VQGIEVFATILAHDDHVLDPNAADGFAVQARFDGDHIADHQGWSSCCEKWRFVDFEA
jgi:hypothetical protein